MSVRAEATVRLTISGLGPYGADKTLERIRELAELEVRDILDHRLRSNGASDHKGDVKSVRITLVQVFDNRDEGGGR